MNQKGNSNLLYLDGLRALAAIYVMLYHAVLQYYASTVALKGIKLITILPFFYGGFAVNLFIVLSGFCLMIPIVRNDYFLKGGSILFLKKRIIRILPPYYLAMLFSMVLIWLFIGNKTGTHWDISIPVTSSNIVTHLFLIQDLFTSHLSKINHVFWSISVECRIYLFFPFLVYLRRRKGPGFILLFSIVLSYLLYLVLSYCQRINPDINLYMPGVNPYIILFVFGMLAADYSLSSRKKAKWEEKIPWGLLGIVFFLGRHIFINLLASHHVKDALQIEFGSIFFGIVCLCLLIACARPASGENRDNYLQRFLSWQPLTFIGSFSYSLYLIHAPLIQMLTIYVVDPLHINSYYATILLLILCILIVIPISYVFFILCERPFMRLNKRTTVKQLELAAVLNSAP